MITGVGIDIVDKDRFKKVYDRYGNTFLNKFLTRQEINNLSPKNKIEKIGGLFCAKEALMKATSSSCNRLVNFKEFILDTKTGNPPVVTKYPKEVYKNYNFQISISHENKYITAVAICEK